MKAELRYMVILLLGAYVILLSGIISFDYLYLYGEFRDQGFEALKISLMNTAALCLYVIIFIKYAVWKEKRRWLHYYLAIYAIGVGLFYEITHKSLREILRYSLSDILADIRFALHALSLVIVPLVFGLIVLFDEIRHARRKAKT